VRKIAGIIKDSSSEAVVTAAERLSNHLPGDSWLDRSNHFLEETSAKVDSEMGGPRNTRAVQLPPSSARAKQLSEFVAASVVLHCADGWAYLGRALSAQLTGDTGAARHLGYYAELRGAMSLLASQGIGVFNTNHAIVRHDESVDVFGQRGTHRFAWEALEEWSASSRSAVVVTTIIRPAGASLQDWYEAFNSGAQAKAKGDEYLRLWGLDIARFAEDQGARAESSYRPRTAEGCKPPHSSRAAEFGTALWRALEPNGSEAFGIVDLHLLRRTLESAFRARTQKKPANHPRDFLRNVQHAMGDLQLSLPSEQVERFLVRKQDPVDLALVVAAENKAGISDPENHLHLIARASLLLRLSTGCARSLLDESGVGDDELLWWCDQLGSARSLFAAGGWPDESAELWEDVEQALKDLEHKTSNGADVDYSTLHSRCSRELDLLGSCERIGLVGLAA
jgi:hypothetical protein